MDDKEKAALRATTEAKPIDTFDGARYDGRVAKQQWKRDNQDDGKVHERSCY